jgi:hypothetical protein
MYIYIYLWPFTALCCTNKRLTSAFAGLSEQRTVPILTWNKWERQNIRSSWCSDTGFMLWHKWRHFLRAEMWGNKNDIIQVCPTAKCRPVLHLSVSVWTCERVHVSVWVRVRECVSECARECECVCARVWAWVWERVCVCVAPTQHAWMFVSPRAHFRTAQFALRNAISATSSSRSSRRWRRRAMKYQEVFCARLSLSRRI